MSDLKPCPFCGVDPSLEIIGGDRRDIACHNTACSINPQLNRFETQAEAFEQWNTRALEHSAQAANAAGHAQLAGLSDVLENAAAKIIECADDYENAADYKGEYLKAKHEDAKHAQEYRDLAAQLLEWAKKLKGTK